jgi:hypothetical protein
MSCSIIAFGIAKKAAFRGIQVKLIQQSLQIVLLADWHSENFLEIAHYAPAPHNLTDFLLRGGRDDKAWKLGTPFS